MSQDPDENSSRKKTLLVMQIAATVAIVLLLGLLYRLQSTDEQQPAEVTLSEFKAPVPPYRKAGPDFKWQDAEGKVRSLNDLMGHVVLVSVWAHWCAPCLVELPTIDNLYQRLDDPNFSVLGLNADTDEGHIKSALDFWQTENLSFENYFLTKNDPKPKNLPATYIFDQKGQLVFESEGAAIDWSTPAPENFIRKLLQETQSENGSDGDPQESE